MLTITFGEDKKIWDKIASYVRDNPQVLYKGIPLTVVSYLLFPYASMFWRVLPWAWAGYEIYQRIPLDVLRKLF